MSGWYAMKRGWLDHEAFTPKGPWSRAEAWVFLVESAAYAPTTIDIGGRPYVVARGSCCFALRFLATKWKWSVKAVQSFLATLERHEAIKVSVAKTGNGTKTKRTQITLCNYEKYQSFGDKRETREKQKGDKEEQGNNISVLSEREAEASAPVEVSVTSSAVWNAGKPFLASRGVKDPGPMIGRWLKSHSPLAILSAIEAAQKSGSQDPIPYITETLKGGSNVKPSAKGAERVNAFIAGARGSS